MVVSCQRVIRAYNLGVAHGAGFAFIVEIFHLILVVSFCHPVIPAVMRLLGLGNTGCDIINAKIAIAVPLPSEIVIVSFEGQG